MSSSGSEEDSFLDITQKLSAMKKNFHVNDVDAVIQTNSVPEAVASTSLSKRNKKKSPVKLSPKKSRKSVDSDSSGSIDLEEFRSKYPPLEEPKKGRGRGRGRKRKCVQNSPNLADSQLNFPRRRKRSSADSNTSVVNDSVPSVSKSTPRSRNRGRGRGRGRGMGRNNSNMFANIDFGDILSMLQSSVQAIATYSVGNTDEYEDQCDNQALFSQKKNNDAVAVDNSLNDSLEDNEEFSVKVNWQNSDIYQFKIRKHQKFTAISKFFAKQENVTHDRLLFVYQDRILKEDDTPGSIDYSIAKFIEGGIVSESMAHLKSDLKEDTQENTDGIKLKFQCQNVKKPLEIYINAEEKMSIAMIKYAEHLEKTVDQLRFVFDGDIISGKSTPQDLELEGGECIDVKIIS